MRVLPHSVTSSAIAAVALCWMAACQRPQVAQQPAQALSVGAWQVLADEPSPRFQSAMAYDSRRARVVLYGGTGFIGSERDPVDGTWSWDGAHWTQISTNGNTPGRSASHCMTYDPVADRVYLYRPEVDQLWAFDGAQWSSLPGVGATTPANTACAIAYDPVENHLLLVAALNTWTFASGTWTAVPVVPQGFGRWPIAYDEAHARVVAVGNAQTTYWDGSNWQFLAISPPGASASAMVYDRGRGTLVYFSVASPVRTYALEPTGWNVIDQTGPDYRQDYSAAYDAARGKSILFGGRSFGDVALGDTWLFGSSWARSATGSPDVINYHAATYDSRRGKAVLISDTGSIGSAGVDVWEWNGSSWALTPSSTTAPVNRMPVTAYDSRRGRTVLFGGFRRDFAIAFGDTWEWTGTTWAQISPTGPSPDARGAHSMAYDSVRGKTVLFGGFGINEVPNSDTWEWDGANWSHRSNGGPSPRGRAAMAYDASRGRVVLHGGSPDTYGIHAGESLILRGVVHRDTWEWDGATWTPMSAGLEFGFTEGRRDLAMAYDADRKRIVLFGGENSGAQPLSDLWEWDGVIWRAISTSATQAKPAPRSTHSMTYDAVKRTILLFGGNQPGRSAFRDLWSFHVRGNTCSSGSECNTGYCVDGVCCEAVACGTCERCDLAGHDGQCFPVDSGVDDTCAGPKSCTRRTLGQITIGICGFTEASSCATANDCHSGFCVDGVCCESACTGSCQSCALPGEEGECVTIPADPPSAGRGGLCGSYVCHGDNNDCPTNCTDDSFCASTHYCSAAGGCLPQKTQGTTCFPSAGVDCIVAGCRVCETGNCTDGVCCDSACGDACQACSVATGAALSGTCGLVAARAVGRGLCGAYLCGGDASCPVDCEEDADCAGGGGSTYCVNHECRGVLPLGLACTLDVQCASEHCIDGVCCASRCEGECVACDVDGHAGTCSLTPLPRDGDCQGEGACSATTCVGASVDDAHCAWPDATRSCGVCLNCNGAGVCDQLPSGAIDSRCSMEACGNLPAGPCFHYVAPDATMCASPGVCVEAAPASCRIEMLSDGTFCQDDRGAGICSAGACGHGDESPTTSPGCATLARDARTDAATLASIALALWLSRARRRSRHASAGETP